MNPIKELYSFDKSYNSLFYILGLLVCFFILLDLVHSTFADPKRYFYKIRNSLKTILLSLNYLNPIYFFSVMIILDILFIAG